MYIYTTLSSIKHNPHYLNRYIKFIEACNGSGKIKHHICPKSMFSEYSILKSNRWNCALLTERQHFIAHWMLWKVYRNRAMTAAFNMMNQSRVTSKVYEILILDSRLTRLPITQETRRKMQKPKSEEQRCNMLGNANHTGHMHSNDSKLKMSLSHIGKIKSQIDIKCPYCDKSGRPGAMIRWHFDNCKKR